MFASLLSRGHGMKQRAARFALTASSFILVSIDYSEKKRQV
jgi:hypothetical protein